MRKYLADIAWETEVWCADNPTHLIHFNVSGSSARTGKRRVRSHRKASIVNIHVLVADVLERRRFGMSAGGGCRGVLRLRGAQVGADSGGRQGFPVRASRMPVRTSTPCLRMVSM